MIDYQKITLGAKRTQIARNDWFGPYFVLTKIPSKLKVSSLDAKLQFMDLWIYQTSVVEQQTTLKFGKFGGKFFQVTDWLPAIDRQVEE